MDSMTIIYMVITVLWLLLIARRSVIPTQWLGRVKEHPVNAG